MVEGESGLLAVLPPSALLGGSRDRAWNRSMGELRLSNGCQLKCFAAETPERLRGPQHHRAWADEPASWADAAKGDALNTTWNNMILGLRLGQHPQVVVTGTPKPLALVKEILARADTVVSRSSTYANLANLAPTFAAQVIDRYSGTRLGRQELEAEVLEDVEGALWSWAMIDLARVVEAPPLVRVVVGVDPAGSSKATADETGIIVAGMSADRQLYVIADRSLRASPDTWGRKVVEAFDYNNADRVVAERNFGAEMVEHVLRTVRPDLALRTVVATRGKVVRAEPVAALYEQGRVHHVGSHPQLETQLTTWQPGRPSPDRLDALVWAITDLVKHGPRTVSMAPPARIAHRILN